MKKIKVVVKEFGWHYVLAWIANTSVEGKGISSTKALQRLLAAVDKEIAFWTATREAVVKKLEEES